MTRRGPAPDAPPAGEGRGDEAAENADGGGLGVQPLESQRSGGTLAVTQMG
jgi:hypothetical protein